MSIIWLLAEGEAAAPDNGGIFNLLTGPILPFVAIGILFYLMLIRPEHRKRAALKLMLENLKKNDRVITVGGIHGTVVSVSKGAEDVMLKVDESNNTRLRVQRSHIAQVVAPDHAPEKEA